MPKPTKGLSWLDGSLHIRRRSANPPRPQPRAYGGSRQTEPKARALRPYAEKLITHAKSSVAQPARG